jgi:hypothetical protein
VLVADYEEKLRQYEEGGFIRRRGAGFFLTDRGMDCYNGIIVALLREI